VDNVLDTRGLCRRFGDVEAVRDLDLAVPRGSVFGFLGPNGAGKSTTIRLLLGLLRPSAGEVRLFGQDLARHRVALLRRVGALVESPSLYDHLTGVENLEVTRRLLGLPRRRVGEVLDLVGLTAAGGRLVRGYSLGMRQRLGLALALLSEPEILLLDEPTNGLDPAGIHGMRELVRGLPARTGATVFLSSHLLGEVEHVASHVGVVHCGQLLFQGPLDDLLARRREHVELGAFQPDAARRLLADEGLEVQPGPDDRLHVVDGGGRHAAARVNRVLVTAGQDVFHVRPWRQGLEEVFLEMTGGSDATGPAGSASEAP